MHRIHYAGGEWITTDEVAIEFLQFAIDMAKRATAVAVEVPIVRDGGVHPVTFVIGPASQLAAEPAPDLEEVDMASALEQLRADRETESRRGTFAVFDDQSGTFVGDF